MAEVKNPRIPRSEFLDAVKAVLGDVDEVTRKDITLVVDTKKVGWPNWLCNDPDVRRGYGVYSIKAAKAAQLTKELESMTPEESEFAVAAMAQSGAALKVVSDNSDPVAPTVPLAKSNAVALVPSKAPGYVPFGHFPDVRSIIKSKKFYPMYITGMSGNGKTMMVEQVCAAEIRECIRVNITIETDEDDLIGGFRLEEGKTVWQDGPVVVAMERGAVLLLDEVDLGSNKLMCLQPVLEGKGVYLKKTNRLVKPAEGFTVVATANTKGKGSDDGRFIGTNVMNEAFLERFSITLEQEYPAARTESKILANILKKAGVPDTDFVDKLVNWADVVRKTFATGGISDIISTRRLVHICEAYVIFEGNREKAIRLCLNRFDPDTKNGFLELYKKVDETVAPQTAAAAKAPLDDSVAF
jgi:hypothetical protein